MRASAKTVKPSKVKSQKRKLPPDPDGLLKRAAARATKVIGMYDDMKPGIGRDCLVHNLLHDLMHLCNRDPTLGTFDETHGFAIHMYDELVKESEEMVS